MKKYLRFANLIMLGAGGMGFLLMQWLYAGGTDARGLYPAVHPAWILVGILTVAVLVVAWLLARQAGANRSYRQNFPPSLLGALGCVSAAIGLLTGGFDAIGRNNTLGMVAGVLGIGGAFVLFWAAICRFRGLRSKLSAHIPPCFFFTLQLFILGQGFGAEPEMYRYLYRFWGCVSMVPACYWLWGFDVNLGKRRNCLFWCLVAGYCNLVAAAGSDCWLMHIGVALWMLSALPRLRYLPKTQHSDHPQESDAQPSESIGQETQEEETPPLTSPMKVDLPTVKLPTEEIPAAELPDPDAILAKLLQEYGHEDKN